MAKAVPIIFPDRFVDNFRKFGTKTQYEHLLNYLHKNNPAIAHRDLRSANIFVSSLNQNDEVCCKIGDFGLSLQVGEELRYGAGCWEWMAPEHQIGEGYTEACDLYSFAIVAFEIFRGKSDKGPFYECAKGMRKAEIEKKIMIDGLRPSLPSNVPKWMKELINNDFN